MKTYLYKKFPFKKRWTWFADPADDYHVSSLNVFSYRDLNAAGFKKKKGLTTVVKLNQDLEVIRGKFRKKFISEQMDKGLRRGIVTKQDDNFSDFYRLYRGFRRAKKLAKDSFAILKREGILFSAYYGGEMLAGGIFIGDDQYLRAWVLASKRLDNLDGPQREIVGQANRLIIWEALRYAKAKGMIWLDLGGINPNSNDRQDLSLAEFKEAFGGERVETFYYYKNYSWLLKLLIKVKKLWSPN